MNPDNEPTKTLSRLKEARLNYYAYRAQIEHTSVYFI